MLARILRESFPEIAPSIRRGWQSRVGCDDCDITGLPLIWIEHKQGKQPNIREAYRQAKRDSKGKGAFPVAIVQDDGARERLVTLNLPDFIRILKSAYGHLPALTCMTQVELPFTSELTGSEADEPESFGGER